MRKAMWWKCAENPYFYLPFGTKQKEISVGIIVLEGEKIWKFRRLYIYLKKKKTKKVV